MYVDSTFFRVFPLKFDYGTAANSLDKPASIVVSRVMAARYFGDANPIGQKMLIDKKPVEVTGVFEKDPKFHLSFDYLRPMSSTGIPDDRMQKELAGWQAILYGVYVKCSPRLTGSIRPMEGGFTRIIQQRAWSGHKDAWVHLPAVFSKPLPDIHLHSCGIQVRCRGTRQYVTYVNALISDCGFYPVDRLLQFHQSLHRAVRPSNT